jgi:hypothetical protein
MGRKLRKKNESSDSNFSEGEQAQDGFNSLRRG